MGAQSRPGQQFWAVASHVVSARGRHEEPDEHFPPLQVRLPQQSVSATQSAPSAWQAQVPSVPQSMSPQQSDAVTQVLPWATQHCWTLLALAAHTSAPQQSPDDVHAVPVVLHAGVDEHVPPLHEKPVQQSDG